MGLLVMGAFLRDVDSFAASLINTVSDKLTSGIVYVHIACEVGRLWHAIHLVDCGVCLFTLQGIRAAKSCQNTLKVILEITEPLLLHCNHTHASSTNTPLLTLIE